MTTQADRKKLNYIDNQKFAEAMKAHRKLVEEAKAKGESPRIPVSNYIGECFYKIANKLSLRPNFIGYSYREEMVSDALETMIANAHHFDPNAITRAGPPNPFSYFTMVAWRAFIHRINREKKQEYVKFKMTEQSVLTGDIVSGGSDGNQYDAQQAVDLNTEYYNKLAAQYDKPKKQKKTGLDKFVDE